MKIVIQRVAEASVTINQKKVANIKTNNFGHAVFNLPFHNNIDYVAIVNYKNEIYKRQVPQALDSGIIIHKKRPVNNKTTQDFVIKISSDLLTKYNKETFFATIHRNHKLLYVLPFEINSDLPPFLKRP